MRIVMLFFLLLIGFNMAAQAPNAWQFSLITGVGTSFQETVPQKSNDYNRRYLNARFKRDNFVRFRVQSPCLVKNRVSLSFGVNYGEVNYVQPIFNSAAPAGVANGYNTINEYFHFSRNYLSAFLGVSGNLSFYDGAVLLNGGLHVSHSRFVNSNNSLGAENYRTWGANLYRYSMQIKEKNAPIILDLELSLKFRLTNKLYLNLGLNYVGGRRMEYDYFYEFKTYSASTNTWTEPTTHKNFRHIEQPRRIDHVFYLHTGISYTPNFQRKKKE